MTSVYLCSFLILFSSLLFSQEKMNPDKNISDSIVLNNPADSLEYEVIIMDVGFETWLLSHAKPKIFYSQAYYENWNRQYATQWNIKYYQGGYGGLIESDINYNYSIDYGLDVNYLLYNYFLFFEQKNNIRLIKRKGN